ncbi:MAG TPA: hypothetical protein VGF97_14875 [Rhizomicrobium sp.]
MIGGTTDRWFAPHGQPARLATAVILIAGCIGAVIFNWPGQLSYDSIAQLHDGRFGHYNAWHPPVMAWMLGVADAISPGAGLFMAFDATVLTASLLSLLWMERRCSWLAVCAAVLIVAVPQFVLYQGIVWKDVLFADATVAGYVLLAHAASRWTQVRIRTGLLVTAALFLALATLTRQNGAIVLAMGAAAAAFIARSQSCSWRKSLAFGMAVLLFASVVVIVASMALAFRVVGQSGPLGQIKLLQLYDIIGMVKASPRIPLDTIAASNPDLERLIRSDGVRLYSLQRNDTLASSAALQSEFADTTPSVIAAQWREIVSEHPMGYLQLRANVFGWLFLTPDAKGCIVYYAGVDGPAAYLKDLSLTRRFRPQDRVLAGYAAALAATPLLSHATYMLLALALIVFFLRRRRPADIAMAWMLVAAMAFTLSFFVISIACDYRYILVLDLASLSALFYCAVGGRSDSTG